MRWLAGWAGCLCVAACGTTSGGGGGSGVFVGGDATTDSSGVKDGASGDASVGDTIGSDATADTQTFDAADVVALPDMGGGNDTAPDTAKDVSSSTDTTMSGKTLVWDVNQGDGCVVLGTASITASNTCDTGDFVLLAGANVDLMSASQSMPVFCPQGSPASVDAISSDFSGCAWTDYVEGMVGLDGTGYIVRDRNGSHHWKMRIAKDQGSAFTAELAKID